jgi:ankyrin repeat protein
VSLIGDDGVCALTQAIDAGNKECVDILLKNGASPEGAGIVYAPVPTSPLSAAVKHNDLATVGKLISAGVDTTTADTYALDDAFNRKKYDIVELFLRTGIARTKYDALANAARGENDPNMIALLGKYRQR